MSKFYIPFVQKINRFPYFYMMFSRKKITKFLNFTRFLAEKCFPRIFGGVANDPASPTPMNFYSKF